MSEAKTDAVEIVENSGEDLSSSCSSVSYEVSRGKVEVSGGVFITIEECERKLKAYRKEEKEELIKTFSDSIADDVINSIRLDGRSVLISSIDSTGKIRMREGNIIKIPKEEFLKNPNLKVGLMPFFYVKEDRGCNITWITSINEIECHDFDSFTGSTELSEEMKNIGVDEINSMFLAGLVHFFGKERAIQVVKDMNFKFDLEDILERVKEAIIRELSLMEMMEDMKNGKK